MNQFTERYKQATNTELLRIIENSDGYQPLAVETAKKELDSRKLTDSELYSAKEELSFERQDYEQKEQKKQDTQPSPGLRQALQYRIFSTSPGPARPRVSPAARPARAPC